jgi:hypothetical protein
LSDAWSHLTKEYILTRWCFDSKINRLYISFNSFNQLFSHWSNWLFLLQIRFLIIRQLSNISSHFGLFFRRHLSSSRNVCLHWDQIIRDIRVIFNCEFQSNLIWINILSNLVLLDQFLKLFYSQMINLWDQHDHEEIRDFFVHYYDVTIWFYMKLFFRIFVWDLFSRSTSNKLILFFLMNYCLNFLMMTCCDRFSLIYWLMLLLLLLKRKFYWLLANDVPSS